MTRALGVTGRASVHYDPRFTVGMRIDDTEPPVIALRKIKVRHLSQEVESFAEAA